MSLLKWLNNFFLLENFLGVYRNYCNQRTTKKCLIIFQIFTQILLHSIIVFGQLYLFLIDDIYNRIIYIYCDFVLSSYVTGFLSVLSSVSNSRTFMSYLESINRVSERFKQDPKFIVSIKRLSWLSTILFLISIAFAVFRSYDVVMNFTTKDYKTYEYIHFPVFFSQMMIRITILSEKVLLFIFIMIVVYLCKCLNSLISSAQDRVGRSGLSINEQCDITKEQIGGWLELYRDLAYCCDKITTAFGGQFFLTLLISVSYYIFLTYQMFYLNAVNIQDKKIAIVIAMYVLLTIIPIIAGQLVKNQAVKFHRMLARLYNTMTKFDSNTAEAKLIKDFIRLMKKNPIEFKLISKVSAGTYLLPMILMSSVNYIIVMLQFSNIV